MTKHGKIRTAALTEAGDRIVVESDKYCIDYTDHNGVRQTVTGTVDLESTKRIAAKHEATAAEYRHGSRNAMAEQAAEHAKAPITQHLADLEVELVAASTSRPSNRTCWRSRGAPASRLLATSPRHGSASTWPS